VECRVLTPEAALMELRQAGVRVRLNEAGMLKLDAAMRPPDAVLALVHAHRDGLAALLRAASLPGVPVAWSEGVEALATMACPARIEPRRWGELAHTSARLLRDNGSALHAARWTAVELFGLHPRAPSAYPPGWGLAWLLDATGTVLDANEDVVGMCRQPGGARMGFRKRPQAGAVPAWELND